MSGTLSPEQVDVIHRLGAATIYEAQGQCGAMDSGIKPLDPSFFVAGRALTVDAKPADNLILHYAITIAKPGDVLVVDAKGFLEAGPWGDVMTFAAQRAGIAGLVIDGSVRDSSAIVAAGFPVFSRGVCMKGTEKKQPGRVNVGILCGGVEVKPGDIVVGDRDGIMVISAADLEQSIALAIKREEKEVASRKALAQGKTTVELLGLGPVLKGLGIG
jgi:4-hydroxy-4-methyl-2-oxoglutarate aldolase